MPLSCFYGLRRALASSASEMVPFNNRAAFLNSFASEISR